VDLTSGPDGNLYYLSRGTGVFRVTSCTGAAPSLTAIQPASASKGSLVLASGGGFQPGTRLFGVLPSIAQPGQSGDLMAPVPPLPLGPVSVRAVNPNGCRSNAVAFTVIPQAACGLLGVEPILALAGAWLVSARRRTRRSIA
jgi:hypothetical protein